MDILRRRVLDTGARMVVFSYSVDYMVDGHKGLHKALRSRLDVHRTRYISLRKVHMLGGIGEYIGSGRSGPGIRQLPILG